MVTGKKWLPFFSCGVAKEKLSKVQQSPLKPQLTPPPSSLQTHPQASNPINLSGTNLPASTKAKGFWKGMVLVGEEQI